mmetsp:Transcript_14547/g.50681  ORF Transcript_14547/g.50681 Transcript_14547/m.50681 type:complete len:287 (-) Transcript_14547:1174-2034(-)
MPAVIRAGRLAVHVVQRRDAHDRHAEHDQRDRREQVPPARGVALDELWHDVGRGEEDEDAAAEREQRRAHLVAHGADRERDGRADKGRQRGQEVQAQRRLDGQPRAAQDEVLCDLLRSFVEDDGEGDGPADGRRARRERGADDDAVHQVVEGVAHHYGVHHRVELREARARERTRRRRQLCRCLRSVVVRHDDDLRAVVARRARGLAGRDLGTRHVGHNVLGRSRPLVGGVSVRTRYSRGIASWRNVCALGGFRPVLLLLLHHRILNGISLLLVVVGGFSRTGCPD